MIYFKPMPAEGYEWVLPCSPEDTDAFRALDGRPRAGEWRPVSVSRLRVNDGVVLKPTDFPWYGGGEVLVLRRPALDALQDMLATQGEILPLSSTDGVELFALNVRTVDALDEANSSLMWFPPRDRIMLIKKIAFFASALEGIDAFRLPQHSPTYVSERFVARVAAAGLRGLVFKEVWSG